MLEPIMFTKREAQVVDALFRTGNFKSAAESLGIGHALLRRHLRNIYHKAGASSAVDLVAMAYRNGGFLY